MSQNNKISNMINSLGNSSIFSLKGIIIGTLLWIIVSFLIRKNIPDKKIANLSVIIYTLIITFLNVPQMILVSLIYLGGIILLSRALDF